MRMIPLVLVTIAVFAVVVAGGLQSKQAGAEALRDLKLRYEQKRTRSVDHSKLPALQKRFTTPQQVTEACISCHNERHKEVLNSSHWNWSEAEYIPGRGVRSAGKKNVINNFCIGVTSNLKGCDQCHSGYGYIDQSFDFSDPKNIDCLVCHDGSDTYSKTNGGMPPPSVDLKLVAQQVRRSRRSNCGYCHFSGGGGNNVKHGDLEQALLNTNRQVDVHMGTDGGNLECAACHITQNHQIRGKLYSVSSMNRDRVTCEQCHGGAPHSDGVLNQHTAKVACQTCHIPEYAKVNATKMFWDWSTAGRLKDGQPIEEKNASGEASYLSIKGSFIWAKNVKPDYIWFNGTADHYLLGDTVSATRPVQMNALRGSYADSQSKIIPVKIHRGRQIYDPATKMLIQPKLYANQKGEGGFWKDFDWNRAAQEGMQTAGLPYSGQYEFIDTVMYWPVNHMVAPKEKSVGCAECHTRTDSRLAGLTGFYMPGRDRSGLLDGLGLLAVGGALAGALLHALARIAASKRRVSA
ncbi:MAG: tetrathionate reductase family octaheme c-type cytochrome [Acidobacteria bacterium]|nr:tetrathionate reductase family octaheme c-type cytochrome [Acidobacteriota bacterium]